MGTVSFDGQAPYALPVTQHTKAVVAGDMVEARIRLATSPRTLEDVIVLLTASQASVLASQLAAAAGEALANKRRP